MIAIKAHKSKESKVAPSGNTPRRFPGRRMEEFSFVHLSSRAREIAGGREELLGLLRDVPESDYELSLTDIVEKGSVDARSSVSKEKAAASSHGGEPIDPKTRVVKEKKKIMVRNGSFRSASDGVLLNVYLPASLTRSLTAPRMSRGAVHRATTECNKRDTKPATLGCWSALWLQGKPRREAAAKIR
ncbi:uncharacterized protein LOC109714375 [Ananas comosus]|uniref:Uncharacterized protein LOC109714375 n=1 Tax=Ananas comosus TaxID=4615 RepID=A0A6P5FF41_ANACO|nr:uncharacterized protein LOC109714375 [Ananas comosus]